MSGFSGIAHAEDTFSIRDLLLGNSITNPRFGCLFYKDENTAEYYLNGKNLSYSWSVVDDLYVSGSNCGASGCKIEKAGDILTYTALDRNYSISVKLHQGNFCDGDLVSSLRKLTTNTELPPT